VSNSVQEVQYTSLQAVSNYNGNINEQSYICKILNRCYELDIFIINHKERYKNSCNLFLAHKDKPVDGHKISQG